jgi:hypothetical protein
MISNSKQNCITDLSASVKRTAVWRRGLQAKYPNDPRNGRAGDTLEKLTNEVSDLTDQQWSQLKPFYSWESGTWADAVSETSRQVEFRGVNTLSDFVNRLVPILSQSSVAA